MQGCFKWQDDFNSRETTCCPLASQDWLTEWKRPRTCPQGKIIPFHLDVNYQKEIYGDTRRIESTGSECDSVRIVSMRYPIKILVFSVTGRPAARLSSITRIFRSPSFDRDGVRGTRDDWCRLRNKVEKLSINWGNEWCSGANSYMVNPDRIGLSLEDEKFECSLWI
jgi:hypothetical protein